MRRVQKISALTVVFFFFAGLCFAWLALDGSDNPMFNFIIGTVEKIGRNTVDIRDEDDKVLKRFVYFESDVQIGDRVRVRYEPRSWRIEQLKKMTKLEYKKDGQNLGYISKEPLKDEKAPPQ